MMADEGPNPDPTLRDPHNYSDQAGRKFLREAGKLQDKAEAHVPQSHKEKHEKENHQPAGGFDSTPIPSAPPGYTLRFTFHRAHNLPCADLNSLSSDPYVIANLKTDLPKRHKEDPDLVFRTPTIRRNTNPQWNAVWKVAHVPSSGFTMNIRLYDEDPADHDDRLGVVKICVDNIGDGWSGWREQSYRVRKRKGSKRAYLIHGCVALVSRDLNMNPDFILSVECLGRSEGDGGRAYTIGPLPWTKHYSPLIGRLTGTKDRSETGNGGKKPEKYNFQAVQMQLPGPVPSVLYHRYVEFKPFIAGMFNSQSIRGRILNRALHHQHRRIYNYDRSTLYGSFEESCVEMTKQFLDFVQYDNGGRIFTYVLTLDGQLRFTETGHEFGIDLLSKHTMHSDVSIYIAYSGEFFIRRLKKPWRPKVKQARTGEARTAENEEDLDAERNAPLPEAESDAEDDSKAKCGDGDGDSRDPSNYEIIIDNDSGTYRPNAKYLPVLRDYIRRSLPCLRVVALDSQADAEKMTRMKQKQVDRKMKGGIQYLQRGSVSESISSSDEEDLDALVRKRRKEVEDKEGGSDEVEKHGKGMKLKQRIKGSTTETRNAVASIAGHAGRKEDKEDGQEHSGTAGVVGENGPVRTRDKKVEGTEETAVEEGQPRTKKKGS